MSWVWEQISWGHIYLADALVRLNFAVFVCELLLFTYHQIRKSQVSNYSKMASSNRNNTDSNCWIFKHNSSWTSVIYSSFIKRKIPASNWLKFSHSLVIFIPCPTFVKRTTFIRLFRSSISETIAWCKLIPACSCHPTWSPFFSKYICTGSIDIRVPFTSTHILYCFLEEKIQMYSHEKNNNKGFVFTNLKQVWVFVISTIL